MASGHVSRVHHEPHRRGRSARLGRGNETGPEDCTETNAYPPALERVTTAKMQSKLTIALTRCDIWARIAAIQSTLCELWEIAAWRTHSKSLKSERFVNLQHCLLAALSTLDPPLLCAGLFIISALRQRPPDQSDLHPREILAGFLRGI
jgi:hypothetical protein